jgi:hypothetical protein
MGESEIVFFILSFIGDGDDVIDFEIFALKC